MNNNRLCDFCGSDEFNLKYKLKEWTIVKCKRCGFVYTTPVPQHIEEFYSEEYFKDIRHEKSFYNEDGTEKIHLNYENRIKIIENFVEKRGRLLEIGAATGSFLNQMRRRGWITEGVELSQYAVGRAQENYGLNLFCGDYVEFNSEYGFDVICMFQTLEHMLSPNKVLQKAYSDLNRGGILVVEVPNFNAWDIKWDEERKILQYDLPRHVNHFTPKFLKKILQELGFKVIYIDRYYPDFIIKLLKNRNKNVSSIAKVKTTGLEEKVDQLPLLKINLTWKNRVLNFISLFFPGWRFTIVARKDG